MLSLLQAKLFTNEHTQRVLDFLVTRDRCGAPVAGVQIDVVAGTASLEDAAKCHKGLNEFAPLQSAILISRVSALTAGGSWSSIIKR